MNPSERSLQIVAVGLGQAGGNLAAELHRRGYPALAFNTAQTDLSSLGAGRLSLPDAQRIYIGLEGADGAGSDLDYGAECIRANASRIREAVEEHADGADVVLVAAGLGGGTGSCVAELANALEGLPVVLLTTLPHAHESGIAKVNALRGVHDVASAPSFGWVLIDNAALARRHRDVPLDGYFETINRDIIEPLDVFNRLNDRDAARAIRTLDGEDFRTLLLSGGVLNYHVHDLPKLAAEEVLGAVRGALQSNPMMPHGGELANVAYLGLVIEASERALAESAFSIYEEIAEQLKSETGGAAVYIGLYRKLGEGAEGATLRVLASSRGLPEAVRERLAEAEREAGTIQKKAQQGIGSLDLGGLEALRLVRRPAPRMRAGAAGSKSKPAAKAAEPASKPADETPPLKRPSQVEKLRRLVTSAGATDVAAPEPEAAKPVEKAPEAPAPERPAAEPSRGRYESLAKAFRAAKNDSKRLYIARELVAAQRSGEALERFYAVEAMAKLDTMYFRDALVDAARDSDKHVADLARRAIEGMKR